MKQPKPGATAPESQAIRYSLINPLIDDNHNDTTAVIAPLAFLSRVLADVDPEAGLHLNYGECWGLSLLLKVCADALETMKNGGVA
jgi:hypothetical protein